MNVSTQSSNCVDILRRKVDILLKRIKLCRRIENCVDVLNKTSREEQEVHQRIKQLSQLIYEEQCYAKDMLCRSATKNILLSFI